ncbi:MAG: 2-aminoethylphosphonate--pyruvate transaminase [Tepidanaerobacteraceae bacterium]|jgi:2-aminoethylphosphonate-pyruvate transaminase|nr:2-aminoethylphosphonate--pyruvate transaminase [Tepidanaerobacteraceae bacterium]
MRLDKLQGNPYLLFTPGPLSTTAGVKAAMLKDQCTWDEDYNGFVQEIRERLVGLATKEIRDYTAILMQGSGTFCVESVIGSAIPRHGKLLVVINGVYGRRIAQIAEILNIDTVILDDGELMPPDLGKLENVLKKEPGITHVAAVHCETTTGMLNPIDKISEIVKKYDKVFIVDAMSSFGGIEFDVAKLKIDFLISSANKCIQGVPGFGFIIAEKDAVTGCKGRARSLALDLYDQWRTMEEHHGKWRFTSPTHAVLAFHQALLELEEEGGIKKRYERYRENQQTLLKGMQDIGFKSLLPLEYQSPIVTSFFYPESAMFDFKEFYNRLKACGFIIYPGKLTQLPTFRIGSIGDISAEDVKRLVETIKQNIFWK